MEFVNKAKELLTQLLETEKKPEQSSVMERCLAALEALDFSEVTEASLQFNAALKQYLDECVEPADYATAAKLCQVMAGLAEAEQTSRQRWEDVQRASNPSWSRWK